MPRGKDKTQRKRRTRDEIQADKEENRRRLEATRARAIERQAAAASNPHPEPQFKHMHFNLCDGGDYNIGSFEALLEDSVKETAEGASVGDDHDKTSSTSKKFFEKSDFGRYAVLLMKQLQFECSKRENANGGARNDGLLPVSLPRHHRAWRHPAAEARSPAPPGRRAHRHGTPRVAGGGGSRANMQFQVRPGAVA